MKILDSIWFGTRDPEWKTIGIVLMETEHGERKAYIGKALGIDQQLDEQAICRIGTPFHFEILADSFARWRGNGSQNNS